MLVAEQASLLAVRDFAVSLLGTPDTLLQAAMYRLGFLRTPYATRHVGHRRRGQDR